MNVQLELTLGDARDQAKARPRFAVPVEAVLRHELRT